MTPATLVVLLMQFVIAQEGMRLNSYRDPVGLWTIGVGHTSNANKGHGLQVSPGMRITKEQCEEILKEDLAEALAEVDRLVKVPLTTGQRAALGDMVFNIGASKFAKSGLLRVLNQGNYVAAGKALLQWDKAGNPPEPMPGLTNRCGARKAFWDMKDGETP